MAKAVDSVSGGRAIGRSGNPDQADQRGDEHHNKQGQWSDPATRKPAPRPGGLACKALFRSAFRATRPAIVMSTFPISGFPAYLEFKRFSGLFQKEHQQRRKVPGFELRMWKMIDFLLSEVLFASACGCENKSSP
jgi:hypothetical protein